MTFPPFRVSGLLFIAFLLPFAGGCGDGRGVRVPISGIVTVDGQPLKHGSISFLPLVTETKTRKGGGALDGEGRYQVSSYTAFDGLLRGTYEVAITGNEPKGETSQKWHAPKKYSEPTTSGLTVEITESTDGLNFELSWEGESPSKPFVERGL